MIDNKWIRIEGLTVPEIAQKWQHEDENNKNCKMYKGYMLTPVPNIMKIKVGDIK